MADFIIFFGKKKKKKNLQMGKKKVGRARRTGFFFSWPNGHFFRHASLWKFIVSNGFLSQRVIFRIEFVRVIIPKGLFSKQTLFQKVVIPKGCYSERYFF